MVLLVVLFGVWLVALPVTTWVFYLALMHADKLHADGLIEPTAERWARRLLPVALLHNAALNLTWMTVYFWDWPREWTTTARLNRMVATAHGKRLIKAYYIRRVYLNNFDRRGIHT